MRHFSSCRPSGQPIAIVTAMQRMRAIVSLAVVVLLSGCSAFGAKASPSATVSAAAQQPPVSSAAFNAFAAKPGIIGSFTTTENNADPSRAAAEFRITAQRVPCLKDYTDRIALMDQAVYLRSSEERIYLLEMRFPTAEQAEALRAGDDAIVQCITSAWMGSKFSQSGTVRAGGQDYPVYASTPGDDFRFTVLTARNIVAVVIVNRESEVPMDMMATEVYSGIMRMG